MNSKHRKTYAAIMADPVSPGITWNDIEAMLLSVGCELIEGTGSRVRFSYRGIIAAFHRPHPAKEAKRYQVRDVRDYLSRTGIVP